MTVPKSWKSVNFVVIIGTFSLFVFVISRATALSQEELDDFDEDFQATQGSQQPLNLRAVEKRILDEVLDTKTYDAKIRPDGVGGKSATIIIVNTLIRTIARIDDVKMEYSVQLTFREQWTDERLRFDNIRPKPPATLSYLTLTNTSQIWMPDLFFSNEREGHLHHIIMPNVYIRIFPNGELLYSERMSLTLSCPMILKLFPMDKQVCNLRMASYGWTTDDVIFKWKRSDPVQISKPLHLPRFTLEQYTTEYCDSVTNTGSYSCLKVDLLFKRQFSYYLLQIYMPSCMLVIVSWVSFWLDPDSPAARVPIGVTTLLTMVSQTAGTNQKLPPVSYTKALDVWTGVCLTFVFGALLEYALVNYTSRKDKHRLAVVKHMKALQAEAAGMQMEEIQCNVITNKDDGEQGYCRNHRDSEIPGVILTARRRVSSIKSTGYEQECPLHSSGNLPSRRGFGSYGKTWLSRFPSRSKRIDVISRIVFPLLFAFFNIAYWSAYVLRQEQGGMGEDENQ